jgi:hypothetical protein
MRSASSTSLRRLLRDGVEEADERTAAAVETRRLNSSGGNVCCSFGSSAAV